MSDDGGSTGGLRDELGVLPPGDVRQCLVALSDSLEVRNLFSYRFSDGQFEGHSLGNIILSGLELQHDSFEEAVRVAGEILHIAGRVIPVTLQQHTLCMQDGPEAIRGECRIGSREVRDPSATVWLEPKAVINPRAAQAILAADMVVLAPGNFYGSLLPLLSAEGMAEALAASQAVVVCVANLVNKPGVTQDWHVVDYVQRLEQKVGQVVDIVLYNNKRITPRLLQKYAADGELPVHFDAKRFKELTIPAIGRQLVAKEIAEQDPADTAIRRTLIRHDADRVCAELTQLLHR